MGVGEMGGLGESFGALVTGLVAVVVVVMGWLWRRRRRLQVGWRTGRPLILATDEG